MVVYYRVPNSRLDVSILSHINPAHVFPAYYFRFKFNIILLSKTRSSKIFSYIQVSPLKYPIQLFLKVLKKFLNF